jgi:hypothetical protein
VLCLKGVEEGDHARRTACGDRVVLVDLRPEGPRELREDEATANACAIGDALARSDAELINLNGSLLLIRDGKPVQVSQPVLA